MASSDCKCGCHVSKDEQLIREFNDFKAAFQANCKMAGSLMIKSMEKPSFTGDGLLSFTIDPSGEKTLKVSCSSSAIPSEPPMDRSTPKKRKKNEDDPDDDLINLDLCALNRLPNLSASSNGKYLSALIINMMTAIPSGTNSSTILDSHLLDKKLNENELNNLSKNQLKKIKKKEKWLANKSEKRLKERLKTKEKRAFARANNINLGPSRKSLKKCTMENSTCKLTITIDMGFDDLMIEKDIAKLIKQILRCYTLNRRALAPVQFSLTNFNNKSKEQMEKHNGYEHWDVKFFSESYCKVYDSQKIIYLTSESENIIDKLDQDSVYVIGGLVDHNGHKGLCHKLAIQAGVQHARLPLDKFLNMKTRKVLAVNHVFEIMLRISEGKTWQDAFLEVLPLRKNAKLVAQMDKDEIDSSIEIND